MNDSAMPPTPAWIRRGDGQVAPFEPHLISQALFAATEDLGQPNAFLARELTDSIGHFFAQETGDAMGTTAQLAELIEKVVRELGQPALAKAYSDRQRRPTPDAAPALAWESRFAADVKPHEVARASLTAYSLRAVYSPDLAAAHHEGLLALTDLAHPARMRSAVVEAWGREGLSEAELHGRLLEAQARAACQLIVDGPERWFDNGSAEAATRFWRALACHQVREGSPAVFVQVNVPSGRQEAPVPLFDEAAAGRSSITSDAWIDSWLTIDTPGLFMDWHMGKSAELSAQAPAWFCALAKQPQRWPRVRFVFQRQRKTVLLGEGIERGQAGGLGLVGLNLPRLARWPGVDGDPTRFLAKLPSLARMGVAAGVQRRQYLRRQPLMKAGFVTERAAWLVGPIGLDAAVQTFLGAGMAASPASLDLGVRIVDTLMTSLRQAANQAHLQVSLAGGVDAANEEASPAWGLTPWDSQAPAGRQVLAAAALHQAAGGGTAWIRVVALASPTDLWQILLSDAKTEVCRLGFVGEL